MFAKYVGRLNVTIRLEVIQKAAIICWEQMDYYGKFWLSRDSNVKTPLVPLARNLLLLASKRNLITSLRFYDIIIIRIIIITIRSNCNKHVKKTFLRYHNMT